MGTGVIGRDPRGSVKEEGDEWKRLTRFDVYRCHSIWKNHDVEMFRELPTWKKEFKAVWKKAMKIPITIPLNEKYRPDPHRSVCTCPQLIDFSFASTDLLPTSYSTRNRTAPLCTHPSLIPIDEIRVSRYMSRLRYNRHAGWPMVRSRWGREWWGFPGPAVTQLFWRKSEITY